MLRIVPLALLLCVALTGCTSVKPWEREILARPDMAFDPDPSATARSAHIHHAKEASLPGASAGGGGCGCN